MNLCQTTSRCASAATYCYPLAARVDLAVATLGDLVGIRSSVDLFPLDERIEFRSRDLRGDHPDTSLRPEATVGRGNHRLDILSSCENDLQDTAVWFCPSICERGRCSPSVNHGTSKGSLIWHRIQVFEIGFKLRQQFFAFLDLVICVDGFAGQFLKIIEAVHRLSFDGGHVGRILVES